MIENCKFTNNAAPNRFRINPGSKWDGVDRSNRYEQRWFERENEKQAKNEMGQNWAKEDL